ncbi:MAG TPA: hypothetical protein VG713_08635 [Pirellulales bacterium]|nr:hypothetical protein [Pirellulales bacterium]
MAYDRTKKNATSDDDGRNDPLVRAARALKQLATDGKLLYDCDPSGYPHVHLPGDDPAQSFPVKSERVTSWLANFVFEKTGFIPGSRDLQSLSEIMTADAWERGQPLCTSSRLQQIVRGEPVALVLLAYMGRRAHSVMLATEMYRQMKSYAEHAGLAAVRAEGWPAAVNLFTRKLRTLSPLLKEVGFKVHCRHTHQGCRITVSRHIDGADGDTVMPSPEPSAVNGPALLDLRQGDGSDGSLSAEMAPGSTGASTDMVCDHDGGVA